MAIKFVLLVNKQGQTRLARYTDSSLTTEERRSFEAEVVRKCLTRVDKQVRSGCVCGVGVGKGPLVHGHGNGVHVSLNPAPCICRCPSLCSATL